ncbi:MAG: GvpL/GvpF family gas vesicle protein, partial [Acidobacteriales bacterium]|nr:GvpL/GvpF family gas vesicle protein [Terriglobales bacterium]
VPGLPHLQAQAVDDLWVFSSAVEDESALGGEERLRAFHKDLRVLVENVDIVTFRYPTVVEDSAMETLVRKEAEGIRESLRRTAGCVQMDVELWETPSGGARAVSGSEYLRAKSLARKATVARAQEIAGSVGVAMSDVRVEERGGRAVLCALVGRGAVEEFVRKVREHEPERRITGPWPAAAFWVR